MNQIALSVLGGQLGESSFFLWVRGLVAYMLWGQRWNAVGEIQLFLIKGPSEGDTSRECTGITQV